MSEQEFSPREAELKRETKETKISCRVRLDGSGEHSIDTGLPFLDHMIGALSKHSKVDMFLKCSGDLEIDDHHSVEDCAIVLGGVLNKALGEKRGIHRFGHAYAPLDEALARAVVDLSGRPFAAIDLRLKREMLGTLACENLTHFLESLAVSLRATLHVELLKGANDHHRAEAAFKALAFALKHAVRVEDGSGEIPSTKGSL